MKGLGGFHLCCDAGNAQAIATLRARKRRPTKPLALLADLPTIRARARLPPDEAAPLADPAAPIVLLPKAGEALPMPLPPGQSTLGWMLPYRPLHHLLLAWAGGPLVMTSGNLSGEPQVIVNDGARARLVPEHGNPVSLAAIANVYEPRPSFEWRGLGEIDASGLRIRAKYAAFDAEWKFGIGYAAGARNVPEPGGCSCDAVMTGRVKLADCPQFGRGCTPDAPLGALMVSSEGACAADWTYGGARAMEAAE